MANQIVSFVMNNIEAIAYGGIAWVVMRFIMGFAVSADTKAHRTDDAQVKKSYSVVNMVGIAVIAFMIMIANGYFQ